MRLLVDSYFNIRTLLGFVAGECKIFTLYLASLLICYLLNTSIRRSLILVRILDISGDWYQYRQVAPPNLVSKIIDFCNRIVVCRSCATALRHPYPTQSVDFDIFSDYLFSVFRDFVQATCNLSDVAGAGKSVQYCVCVSLAEAGLLPDIVRICSTFGED